MQAHLPLLANWLADPINMLIAAAAIGVILVFLIALSVRQRRKLEADRKAWEEARRLEEERRQQEEERRRQEEEERKRREEAERKAREEAERKAREEAERKAREEAERKAREEAERKAREEAERKAKEEAERKAKEEAERKAKEEAERKAKEEAERKAKAEVALKAQRAQQEAQRKRLEEQKAAAKAKPGAAAARGTATVASGEGIGAGRKVLLVEDSATMRQAIDWVLTPDAFVLTTVESGGEALAKAKEVKPDLVIADLSLSDKDGYEICRELRQDDELAKVPVILLHGPTVELDEAKAKEVGATDTFAKPFDSQAFLDKVNEAA